MTKKHDLLGFWLAVVTGAALLALILVRTFLPRIILPEANASSVIGLSLVALVLDHYFARGSRHDFRLIPVYAAVIFGLFPWAAAMTAPLEAVKLALLGAVIFTVLTFLFDTVIDRLTDTPATKAAPLISAFGLFLAAQCLVGIL